MLALSRKVLLEAVFATAWAVVGVEAVGIATLHGWPGWLVRLGTVGRLGVLGVTRGCARLNIVVDTDSLGALVELLQLVGGILLGLDLCLALAVGGLGLLEDADKVLALRIN
jgi:hypothetical protein